MKKSLNPLTNPGYTLASIMGLISAVSIFLPNFIDNQSNWILLLFFIIVIILLIYIDSLNQEIRKLKLQVENSQLTLIQNNENLMQMETKKEYLRLFEDFVKYDSSMFNVQMYKYSIHPVKRNKIDIRINYEMGYTETGHNLNVMMQGNYTFLKSDIKELHKIIYTKNAPMRHTKMLDYHINKLENINAQKLFNNDFNILSLLSILVKMIRNENVNSSAVDFLEQMHEQVYNKGDHLNRKTELVESIIKNEFLDRSIFETFDYKGVDKDKIGRSYYSILTKNRFNEKIIFLFTFYSKDKFIDTKTPDEYFQDFLKQLKDRKLIKE